MINFHDFIQHHPSITRISHNDLLAVEYKCPMQNEMQDIWSPFNYLVYVLNGKKVWKTHDGEVELVKGQSIFVKKGAHFVKNILGEEFCVMMFFFPDDYIASLIHKTAEKLPLPEVRESPNSAMKVTVDEILETFFNSVMVYFKQDTPPPGHMLELKFNELLYHILYGKQHRSLAAYFHSLADPSHATLIDVMESNFPFNLKMEEYARLAGLSLSSFKRTFEAIYNTTPGQWLTEKRIHYAEGLILNTTKTIQEIAFESGFKNHTHFIRVFKEKFGYSPQQYRLQQV